MAKANSCATLFVALLALAVAVYEGHSIRAHERLAVKPILRFSYQIGGDEGEVGLKAENIGTGPALIRSAAFYIDRKPARDWGEVAAFCKLAGSKAPINQLRDDEAIPAGGTALLFSQPARDGAGLDHFLDCIGQHVGLSVTYCSVYDECSTKCSVPDRCL